MLAHPAFTFSDVDRVLQREVESRGYLARYELQATVAEHSREMEIYKIGKRNTAPLPRLVQLTKRGPWLLIPQFGGRREHALSCTGKPCRNELTSAFAPAGNNKDVYNEEATLGYSTYYNGEIAVFPTLTEADAAIVRAVVEGERSKQTQAVFAAIAASPEPDLPWHTGLLKVSEDWNLFLPEEDQSRPGFGMWLSLLIDHFLSARGYVLNGQVSWEGEDPDDRGILFVKDNVIEIVDDLIFNGGPSRSKSLRDR